MHASATSQPPAAAPSVTRGRAAQQPTTTAAVAPAQRPPVARPRDGLAQTLAAAVLQRAVAGISSPEALKANKQAWGTFVLCDVNARSEFQADVLDPLQNRPLSHYIAKAKVSGLPVIRDWYANNAATLVAPAPGRIDIAHQNPAKYGGWGELLRFRWFGPVGPFGPTGKGARIPIAVLGINLHRGPRYAGLGHAWVKIGNDLVFELEHNVITGDKSAIVAALEAHASGDADANVRTMADNSNCVPPVTVVGAQSPGSGAQDPVQQVATV